MRAYDQTNKSIEEIEKFEEEETKRELAKLEEVE